MPKVNSGGVQRRIITPCGKIILAGIRDVNQYMRLHEIYCLECKNASTENLHMTVGTNDIEFTRNGNIVHRQLYTNEIGCYKKM